MPKAAKTNSTPRRTAVLRKTSPAALPARPIADPIFAAIGARRDRLDAVERAEERFVAGLTDHCPVHAALLAWCAASRALVDTAPTTYAGLRALEDYLNDDRNRSLIGSIERTITTDDGFTYRMGGGPGAVNW